MNITDELLGCLPRLEPALPDGPPAPVLGITDEILREQDLAEDRWLAGWDPDHSSDLPVSPRPAARPGDAGGDQIVSPTDIRADR